MTSFHRLSLCGLLILPLIAFTGCEPVTPDDPPLLTEVDTKLTLHNETPHPVSFIVKVGPSPFSAIQLLQVGGNSPAIAVTDIKTAGTKTYATIKVTFKKGTLSQTRDSLFTFAEEVVVGQDVDFYIYVINGSPKLFKTIVGQPTA